MEKAMNRTLIRVNASLCLLALASLHCGGGGGGKPQPRDAGPPDIDPFRNTFSAELSPQLDLLFMIDNSSEMDTQQANLVASLPAFMDVLKNLPGGLPDLHIAVVTSDMGAGDGSITGCSGNGDNGVFRSAPGVACTDTTLQNSARFIVGPPQANFTAGDITTVLQCLVPVGSSGCGFEHQLASVARALGADGQPPPPENAGFLRPDAVLGILLFSNEDDCSAPVNDVLYDARVNTNLASEVGPLGSFRCNEFGHLCSLNGGAPAAPLRLSPNPTDLTTMVSYDACASSEEAGRLTTIYSFVSGIKALKTDPAGKIVVASIQGPATPYVERWTAPQMNDTGPWPFIVHSCDGSGVSGFGDPGVRLQQFTQAFGNDGLVSPICATDFSPALVALATKIVSAMAPPCLAGVVVSNGGQPDCLVSFRAPNAQGGSTDTPIPGCAANGNTAPCWELAAPPDSSNCAPNDHVVLVDAGSTPPASGTKIEVRCAICIPGSGQSGCP
jgi:hypothetical protein